MLDLRLSLNDSHAALGGELVFGNHAEFREMVRRLVASDAQRLVVDFTDLEFIDSAGLGMLLLLRQEANLANRRVVLRNAQSQVKRMFEVSRFETLFTLEP